MAKSTPQSWRPNTRRRDFLSGVDPVQLIDRLDTYYDDDGREGGSAYRRLYREAREKFLEQNGPEAVNFANLLDSVDAGIEVEAASRAAGFLVRFETCRQLLLGELDPAVLKGGA